MIPKEFTYLSTIHPTIKNIASYATEDNFIGEVIDGYKTKNMVILEEVAEVLEKVLQHFLKDGFSFLIYDAYRPQKAVDHFHRWGKTDNQKMKQKYYPNFSKKEIFEQEMIAKISSHSKGIALDLNLYELKTGKELEMGTIFDFFDPLSFTDSNQITKNQQENRKYLVNKMENFEFKNFSKEWWHFTYKNSQYKDKVWNFDII